MTLDEPEPTLFCASELASCFGVSRQCVSQWRARSQYNGFPDPEPDQMITGNKFGRRMTRVWNLDDVVKWRESYQNGLQKMRSKKRGNGEQSSG